MRQRFLHCISILLLAIFSWYWTSITMFGHVHEVDGAAIVHSHPFSSENNHQHTNSSITTIGIISNFIASITNDNTLTDILYFQNSSETGYCIDSYTIIPYHGYSILRAPPSSFL